MLQTSPRDVETLYITAGYAVGTSVAQRGAAGKELPDAPPFEDEQKPRKVRLATAHIGRFGDLRQMRTRPARSAGSQRLRRRRRQTWLCVNAHSTARVVSASPPPPRIGGGSGRDGQEGDDRRLRPEGDSTRLILHSKAQNSVMSWLPKPAASRTWNSKT